MLHLGDTGLLSYADLLALSCLFFSINTFILVSGKTSEMSLGIRTLYHTDLEQICQDSNLCLKTQIYHWLQNAVICLPWGAGVISLIFEKVCAKHSILSTHCLPFFLSKFTLQKAAPWSCSSYSYKCFSSPQLSWSVTQQKCSMHAFLFTTQNVFYKKYFQV